ncbi:STAS domain-containing protein [Actinoplanes sp. NPDC051859]|uniref:STAS domain-containing protein n=1 Tax=Actinoplanes sp. NPDC051859 TaxID=3363909 RepID=UPI003792393E
MASDSFQISQDAGNVGLSGDFDINARDELRSVLVRAVEAADGSGVVVNFDRVTFLDSEAMGALIDGIVAGRDAGVRVSIVNAHGLVHRVLEVSGVLELCD